MISRKYVDHVERVVAADEVGADEVEHRVLALGVELHRHRREVEQRRGEDDRDDAGLVDLERDVGRVAAEHLAADHAAGVLHRDAALRLLDEDDAGDEDQADHHHDAEDDPALGGLDAPQGRREGRDDLGEDEDRHAVADAAVGDELTEPHDDRGARGHGDDHDQERRGAVVVQQVARAALEQGAVARERHDAGRLQDREAERQVAGVLGDLRLAGLALLLQRLEPWDHHDEQLQDDGGRDVGHDPEREDGELEQRTTGEEVDQAVEARPPRAG